MVGAYVVFISDPRFGRRPLDPDANGIRVGRGARIGTGAILSPPLQVGEEAVIGARSFVRTDVDARTVVAGTPARFLKHVDADELLDDREPEPGGR